MTTEAGAPLSSRRALRENFRAFARGPGHAIYKNSAALIKWLCRYPVGRAGVEKVMRGGGRALLWAFDAQKQDSPEAIQKEWERILRGIGLHPQELEEQSDKRPGPAPGATAAPAVTAAPAATSSGPLYRIGKKQHAGPPAASAHASHAESSGCATCFARCTLDLTARPEDERTCDVVMSINDEMIARLGGQMRIEERLTDQGGTRCVVRVVKPESPESPDAKRAAVPAKKSAPADSQYAEFTAPAAADSTSEKATAAAPLTLPGEVPLWCDAGTARGHFDSSARFYDYIMGYFEVPSNLRAVRHLAPHLPPGSPTVLELGVGTGLGLVTLLRRMPAAGKVLAVDTSEGMIERSTRRLRQHGLLSRVEFLRRDAAATGLPSESMDGVYSSFLLDLLDVPKRRAILAETYRVLRPGAVGSFLVMDAAPRYPWDRALTAIYNAGYARWNPIWMALFDGYAPHCRPIRLRELLEEAGLVVTAQQRAYVTAFPVAIFHVRKETPA